MPMPGAVGACWRHSFMPSCTSRKRVQLEHFIENLMEELVDECRKNQRLQEQLLANGEALKSQVQLKNNIKILKKDLTHLKTTSQRNETETSWKLNEAEQRALQMEELLQEQKEIVKLLKSGPMKEDLLALENFKAENFRLVGTLNSTKDVLCQTEAAKRELEKFLETQTKDMQQRHRDIEQLQMETTNATATTLGLVQDWAHIAERKIPDLQNSLDKKVARLQAAEAQLKRLKDAMGDIRTSKNATINLLEAQIQKEKVDRTFLNKQLDEVKKGSIADQDIITTLQAEAKAVRSELARTRQDLEIQMAKNREHSEQTRIKRKQASDIYSGLSNIQKEMKSTNAEFIAEQSARTRLQHKHSNLLDEHKQLLANFSQLQNSTSNTAIGVSVLQNSTSHTAIDYNSTHDNYLERENSILQEHIDIVSKEREAREELIRKCKLQKANLKYYNSALIASSSNSRNHLRTVSSETTANQSNSTSANERRMQNAFNPLSTL